MALLLELGGMRLIFWRVFALLIGVAAFCVVYVIDWVGVWTLLEYVMMKGLGAGRGRNFPLVAGWDLIFHFFLWGYPAAVGLAATYSFWHGFPSQRKRILLYLLLMAVIGPITFVNYTQSDQLIDLRLQVLFNLITIFVGYTVVLSLRALTPSSHDGLALQSLAILLITAFGIVLPAFYTGVFCLVLFGVIDHHAATGIGDKTALGLSGAVGVIVALLNGLELLRGRKVDARVL